MKGQNRKGSGGKACHPFKMKTFEKERNAENSLFRELGERISLKWRDFVYCHFSSVLAGLCTGHTPLLRRNVKCDNSLWLQDKLI